MFLQSIYADNKKPPPDAVEVSDLTYLDPDMVFVLCYDWSRHTWYAFRFLAEYSWEWIQPSVNPSETF